MTPPATPPTTRSAARKTSVDRTHATTAAQPATIAVTATEPPSDSATSQPSANPEASTARCRGATPAKHSTSPTASTPTPVLRHLRVLAVPPETPDLPRPLPHPGRV